MVNITPLYIYIALSDITPPSDTPIDEDLYKSIINTGILYPIALLKKKGDDKWYIRDGRKRIRCANKLGMTHIPAIGTIVDTQDIFDEILCLEDIERSYGRIKMSPKDATQALYRVLKSRSIEELAKTINKPVEWIKQHLTKPVVDNSLPIKITVSIEHDTIELVIDQTVFQPNRRGEYLDNESPALTVINAIADAIKKLRSNREGA